jgi:hypothetical protein
VDIRLRMPSPENRFDPPIEHTAYVVVREMVRDEGGRGISIDVQRVGSRFVVEIVREGGIPAELVLLEDRVGAVGGELRLDEPTPGVTRVRAELPCE